MFNCSSTYRVMHYIVSGTITEIRISISYRKKLYYYSSNFVLNSCNFNSNLIFSSKRLEAAFASAKSKAIPYYFPIEYPRTGPGGFPGPQNYFKALLIAGGVGVFWLGAWY